MKLYAGGFSLLALVLAAGPVVAQQTPPQDRIAEDRQSPGGDKAQAERRERIDNRDNRGLRNPGTVNPGTVNPQAQPQTLQQTPQQTLQETPQQNREQRNPNRAERAENRPQREQREQAGQRRVEAYFAAKLMLCNQGIVEMSQLARERSTSEDVKQFAQMLAEGHSALNVALLEASPRAAQLAGIDTDVQQRTAGFRGAADKKESDDKKDHSDKPGHERKSAAKEARADKSGQQRGAAAGPLARILEIEAAAAENFSASSKKLLEKYDGQDFDMAFLGLQISTHAWALAELQALESVGDEKFQKVVADARQKMEQHLKEAKSLSEKHEDLEKQSNNQ